MLWGFAPDRVSYDAIRAFLIVESQMLYLNRSINKPLMRHGWGPACFGQPTFFCDSSICHFIFKLRRLNQIWRICRDIKCQNGVRKCQPVQYLCLFLWTQTACATKFMQNSGHPDCGGTNGCEASIQGLRNTDAWCICFFSGEPVTGHIRFDIAIGRNRNIPSDQPVENHRFHLLKCVLLQNKFANIRGEPFAAMIEKDCRVWYFYLIIILALRHEKAAGAECAQPL